MFELNKVGDASWTGVTENNIDKGDVIIKLKSVKIT